MYFPGRKRHKKREFPKGTPVQYAAAGYLKGESGSRDISR